MRAWKIIDKKCIRKLDELAITFPFNFFLLNFDDLDRSRNASSSVKRMVVNDAAKQTNIKYMNRNVGQFFVHTQTFAASNAYTF